MQNQHPEMFEAAAAAAAQTNFGNAEADPSAASNTDSTPKPDQSDDKKSQ